MAEKSDLFSRFYRLSKFNQFLILSLVIFLGFNLLGILFVLVSMLPSFVKGLLAILSVSSVFAGAVMLLLPQKSGKDDH